MATQTGQSVANYADLKLLNHKRDAFCAKAMLSLGNVEMVAHPIDPSGLDVKVARDVLQ